MKGSRRKPHAYSCAYPCESETEGEGQQRGSFCCYPEAGSAVRIALSSSLLGEARVTSYEERVHFERKRRQRLRKQRFRAGAVEPERPRERQKHRIEIGVVRPPGGNARKCARPQRDRRRRSC